MTESRSALTLFSRTAQRAADAVIDSYSTSFGVATKLLGKRHRPHIRAIYALVRVADEIVDGVAAEAGLDLNQQRAALDRCEANTLEALRTGYSADVIIHAFARTARAAGIGDDLVVPFFASMRMDLESDQLGAEASRHDEYVYGSAEVVGLMCLRVFLIGEQRSARETELLIEGARHLGSAFQDVNFLRDLSADAALGRNYLSAESRLSEQDKAAWVARIRDQLDVASNSTALLPRDARIAVRTAHGLFRALCRQVERAPVHRLYQQRVRVSNFAKAAIIARVWISTRLGR